MPKRQQEIRWRRCEQVWQPLIMLIIYVIVLLNHVSAAPLPEVDWPAPPKTSERSPTTSYSHNTIITTTNDTKLGNSNGSWTLHGRLQDDGKTRSLSNASSIVLTVSDHESTTTTTEDPSSAVTNRPKYPPSFQRKIKVLAFILGCCCLVAITVNFINLHSDYEELQEFYIGYMGRKMLIQERRLTSRTYLNLLRREHQLTIENDQFMEITEAFQNQPSAPPVSASSIAAAAVVAAATCLSNDPGISAGGLRASPKRSPKCNGHAASPSTQQALQVYRDGEISFIPLQERGIVIQDGFVLESETASSPPPPAPSRSAVTVAAANVKRKTAMMTTKLTTNSRKYRELMTAAAASPHKKIPNMSVIVMQQPTTGGSSEDVSFSATAIAAAVDSAAVTAASPPFGTNGSEEWLLPLLAKEFIEDHDVEWRNLDYSSDVGPPPTSFWLFICQYDCRIFPQRMSEREEERRKNLLNQFRLWKLLKRKHWNIVVTERAKKEMADREQDHMRR